MQAASKRSRAPREKRSEGSADNVLRCYHDANAADLREGLAWYVNANRIIRAEIADPFDLDLSTACGIVAALSPQVPWARNVALAKGFLLGTSRTAAQRMAVASAILAGSHPLDALNGPKTNAFYRCLVDPSDDDAVCVDGHAYSIWTGRRIMTSQVAGLRPTHHALIQHDYRQAARAAGILPSQMQAVTWVAWRRTHGAREHGGGPRNRVKAS